MTIASAVMRTLGMNSFPSAGTAADFDPMIPTLIGAGGGVVLFDQNLGL